MKKQTILIVDDVDINREILCEMFHEYHTIQAENGREAVDIIAADPDFVFVTTQGKDAKAVQQNIENTLLNNPAWSKLTAVREGRYYVLEKELYNLKPNARWGEAYQKLADILYGEDF